MMSELFGELVMVGVMGVLQWVFDVFVMMIIIIQDDIQCFLEYDIFGIFCYFGGMDVMCYVFGDGQINICGVVIGYMLCLLVLVNGCEVYIDIYGYIVWFFLLVCLDEIQQIEVVKGLQLVFYGFNVVGGVVNIIICNLV